MLDDDDVKNKDSNALPSDAQQINFGNEEFDLVFNIMIGIKQAVGSLFESPIYEPNDRDYRVKYMYTSQWLGSSDDYDGGEFKFIDYAPKIFADIRKKDGIKNGDYLASIGPDHIFNYIWTNDFKTFVQLCSSGKSGSLFYYTDDGLYMLKTIHKKEFQKLRGMLQDYHEAIKHFPQSLMTRYYGLHKIIYKAHGQKKE